MALSYSFLQQDARESERRTNDKAIAASERALATLRELEETKDQLRDRIRQLAQQEVCF